MTNQSNSTQDTEDVVALLRVRRNQDFDGECHLTNDEANRIAALIQSLSDRIDVLEADKELSDLCAKVEADAVSGLRYIEKRYGRLDGVGWDRVFKAHDDLFDRAALHQEGIATGEER